MNFRKWLETIATGKKTGIDIPTFHAEDPGDDGSECPLKDYTKVTEWLKSGGWKEICPNWLDYVLQGKRTTHVPDGANPIYSTQENPKGTILNVKSIETYDIHAGEKPFEDLIAETKKDLIKSSIWHYFKVNNNKFAWNCIQDEKFLVNLLLRLDWFRHKEIMAEVYRKGGHGVDAEANVIRFAKRWTTEQHEKQYSPNVELLGPNYKLDANKWQPAFHATGGYYGNFITVKTVLPYAVLVTFKA